MRNGIFASALGALVSVSPSLAQAESPSSIIERVDQERHLSMIAANINSFDARNLSLLGSLTYYHRTCGDDVVKESDITKIWESVKSRNVDDQTRVVQTTAYADALSAALKNMSSAERDEICQNTKKGVANLKQQWGIN